VAFTGFCARRIEFMPHCILRRRNIFNPREGRFKIRDNFISTDKQHNFFGSKRDGPCPVADHVEIHYTTTPSYGIGTGQKQIR
jgi:hypothetical protein